MGTLVEAFPGRARLHESDDWLEDWFWALTKRFADGEGPDAKQIVASAAEAGELSLLAKRPVEASTRLISIEPRFFRGFRQMERPVVFDADLVVVEGRNSSGKTSLSEAIEWVFTGQLSRRVSGEHGHPTELANCIANEFRPDEEQTSVELALLVDGEVLRLKRVLTKDYSTTASESPESILFADGIALSVEAEEELRQRLLAGVHPILMQHNLRRFVHDDPKARRQYFERLLQIDELTALVEKAVVGPKRLTQIENPDGGTGLAALRAFIAELEKDPSAPAAVVLSELRGLVRLDPAEVPDRLSQLLGASARAAFPDATGGAEGLPGLRDRLAGAQRKEREGRLPLLSGLESARGNAAPSLGTVELETTDLKSALTTLARARIAASKISAAQQTIAQVMEALITAGLVDRAAEDTQTCPVCLADQQSLSPNRVHEVAAWAPLTTAVSTAEQACREARVLAQTATTRLEVSAKAVLPPTLDDKDVQAQLEGAPQRVRALTDAAVRSAATVGDVVKQVLADVESLSTAVSSDEGTPELIDAALATIGGSIARLDSALAMHREDVSHLEEAVGAASRDDAEYRLRERWLELAGLTSGVAEDVAWEKAKGSAKKALDALRAGLIELRTEIIEDARRAFSDQMTGVWKLLRSDSGAQFSRLRIPPPSGRGFKLELELKAVISDGKASPEVDALRVFSESQVNVVGLAAYITRAELLGHRLLIFDDPVQSMDEEHFRSFAASLLPYLLDRGFQVIILTHSETFARRIHDHHYLRESYATLETKPSRRRGCHVDEGNRRVSERLKNAERSAQDGDLQKAWRLVRLAVERMYVLAFDRGNEDFNPESWRGLTAEDMWNKGVEGTITEKAPDMAARLQEILKLTVAGAHDKAATSETDLVDAVHDLRSLLGPLRLGAG